MQCPRALSPRLFHPIESVRKCPNKLVLLPEITHTKTKMMNYRRQINLKVNGERFIKFGHSQKCFLLPEATASEHGKNHACIRSRANFRPETREALIARVVKKMRAIGLIDPMNVIAKNISVLFRQPSDLSLV